jgi:hypothetical protein
VAAASPDAPRFADEPRPALERHYDWLARERDVHGDGLITIVLPDESGLDDAPKYAPVFGWMAHDRPGYYRVVWRARRHRYSATAIVARHEEHVEDVLVNVLYARALLALGGRFALRAQRIVQALLERSWDPAAALFWDLAGGGERPIRVSTWSSLAPAGAARDPGGGQARAGRAPAPAPARLPRRHRDPVGGDQRADLQPALGPLPLLAGAVVDGQGVVARAPAARARLRRGGRPRRGLAHARRAPVRAARVLRPADR